MFREIDSAGIYFGFAAGVIGANPKLADKLLGEMFPLPPEDQIVIVRAIAWSGLPEWKALMGRFVERMPARRVLIERHLYGKLPGLMELAARREPGRHRCVVGLLLRQRRARADPAADLAARAGRPTTRTSTS